MKKLLLILGLILFLQNTAFSADFNVYTEDNYFGLKDASGNIILEPEYKKIIRIGKSSWLVLKRGRYGLVDNNGMILVPIKYRHAERILGKFAKLGNDNDYGLYDETGKILLPPMYSSIELLYGNMFLTCIDFKYGVVDFDGNIILANDFDDIYMPTKDAMRVQYRGEWYEFKRIENKIDIPQNSKRVTIGDKEITITRLVTDTGIMSSYYAVTATDYVLKVISSISPAYEQTIDDLMLSHGAETVSIILNPVWIARFPFVYVKKYVNNLRAPNNGPLSPVKQTIRRKLAD